jgi:hypothetical protein
MTIGHILFAIHMCMGHIASLSLKHFAMFVYYAWV